MDFSRQAAHLKRYPVSVRQTHRDAVVGTYTIELTAIKDLEDYFFGNPAAASCTSATARSGRRINKARIQTFERIADAQARGYNGCRFCLPRGDSRLIRSAGDSALVASSTVRDCFGFGLEPATV